MAKKTNFVTNGKEYYRVSKTIGHKADGTPIRKFFYGNGIKEANEKADEYMNKLKNGLVKNFESISIQELMHTWLFDFLHNSSKLKPSTFQRYEGVYRNYIKDSEISGLKVHNTNLIQLQMHYNKLSKEGYTYSQIETLNKVLKVFFNWAIVNGYALKNPCLNVEIKGNKSEIINNKIKDVEILTEQEIEIIKDYIKGTDYELLFLLDLATGLRQGELLALDWENIDINKKEIKIDRSVKEVYIYDDEDNKHIETVFQTPKTLTSFRIIPIPEIIIDYLLTYKNKKGLIFHDEKGNALKGKNVSTQWAKILKTCNIPHKKFHSIRHTYGSMLLKNGVDIETVGELMGHSAISITQIYLHSTENQKQDAVNKLNHLFKTEVIKK